MQVFAGTSYQLLTCQIEITDVPNTAEGTGENGTDSVEPIITECGSE